MIDKDKTIKKAVDRYEFIFPVNGKHSIDECFFSLRGEIYFIFRTKDKKTHTVKAEKIRTAPVSRGSGTETFKSLLKVINKPIIVRSVIARKPVRACLVNLFPVPGISWSSNPVASPEHAGRVDRVTATDRYPSVSHAAGISARPEVHPHTPEIQPHSAWSESDNAPSDTSCFTPWDMNTSCYEIIAPGCLPVSRYSEIIPVPDEKAAGASGRMQYAGNYPASHCSREALGSPEETTTIRYEVLSPGYLHKRPRPEWKSMNNRRPTVCLHERPALPDDAPAGAAPGQDRPAYRNYQEFRQSAATYQRLP